MTEEDNRFQVFVCNISWNLLSMKKNRKSQKDDLPEQMSIDIPVNVLNQAKKNKSAFNDIVEQFVCNLLTNKFGCEVWGCQVWLPLED